MTDSQWETVIGLEIHVQLSTKSKIFSDASTVFGGEPNEQANEIDLGLPGTLPVVNAEIFPKAIAFGLSVGAEIATTSHFDRKNYFYPDLPKGYQITQMDEPIVKNGCIDIELNNGATRTIRINRAHLEEDAGKSLHDAFPNMTGVDLNRAGIPLLEIVSEPDIRTAEEAEKYAKSIHQLVTYLSISDGNMAEGSFRCDANVSVRREGEKELGTRTEIKNINSFKFLKYAIRHEVKRQVNLIESGQKVTQETRLYDSTKNETRPMRSKETATDYRYFPEPDLLPISLDQNYIDQIKKTLPELPLEKMNRYAKEHGLEEGDAKFLSNDLELAQFYESCYELNRDSKQIVNWLKGEMFNRLSNVEITIKDSPVSPNQLCDLIRRTSDGTISITTAKKIFGKLWEGKSFSVDKVITEEDLAQLSDGGQLDDLIDEAFQNNPKQIEQIKKGKTKVLGYFVGLIMKQTSGKANPKQLNDLIVKKISSLK